MSELSEIDQFVIEKAEDKSEDFSKGIEHQNGFLRGLYEILKTQD